MLTPQVKLLHKVVLFDTTGSVLLLRRSDTSQSRPSKWDLPGGNAEWPDISIQDSSENIMQSLHSSDILREIQEETGLTLPVTALDDPCFFQTFFDQEKRVYSIVVGWCASVEAAKETVTLVLSLEHSEFRWATKSEINTFDFGFAGGDYGFISQIIANAYACRERGAA